ncbi:hypothetical protein SAY86_017383 [Trapa natans]|uniref:Ribosomal RNA small subunit methyltransferase NEP1 n=1 Tax=Trapa natans TaxID=22666 RepID=A0AAN7LRY6_TRANT|nr:hypothetical protein SAY86_017383 [Trapa natans]
MENPQNPILLAHYNASNRRCNCGLSALQFPAATSSTSAAQPWGLTMVRRYPVKGKKRKHKERYDEDVEEENEKKQLKVDDGEPTKTEVEDGQQQPEQAEEKVADELQGLPIAPMETQRDKNSGIVFVLEKASLEVAKVGKSYQLLNSDDHANFLKRNGRNPADYRPDIIHQALLSILDSPLNKAGKVRAVYVKTERGVLFEVKPHVRIPRTYKRFSGIMLQLLQKLSINAAGKREKLLRVIKNPVTQYLPINSRRIGFSHSSEKVVEMQDYVASFSDDTPLVFVVGAMAHGKIETDYTDDFISISNYPLSAACCINIICDAVRRHLSFI